MAVIMNMVYRERAAPRCERNGMEEHRTFRRSGRSEVETNLAGRYSYSKGILDYLLLRYEKIGKIK